MQITKDELVDVLRLRYDAYSAEAVFTNACARAGLDGTKAFDTQTLATFRDALERVGDRVGGVLARLDALLADAAPASGAKPAATPEVKPAAKAEPKAEAKPEPKGKPKAEPKAETTPEVTGTTIALRGLELEDDEQILVCGASAAIGDWKPELAREMTRVGEEWQVTLELPADAEVAFKFLRRDADGEVAWEPGGNRTVRANERLDATWRDVS